MGQYFEPYSVRRGQDSIVSMQVGHYKIDHTQKEYFRIPVAQGKSHWSDTSWDYIERMLTAISGFGYFE